MIGETLEELKARLREIFTQVVEGKLPLEAGVTQTLEACIRCRQAIYGAERRQWNRKDFSAQGTLRILSGLEPSKASRPERILVTNISQGGVRIQTPFLSLDNLHIIGELTDAVWRPNQLKIELELPSDPPQKIAFQGSAEWYLRTGREPYYLAGVSITIISPEDKKKLLTFLEKEGTEP